MGNVERLTVYPNPAQEDLYINGSENGSLKIVNAMGNVVYDGNYEIKKAIHIGDLPNGIYYLQITNSKAAWNQKIIIE